MSHEYRLVLSHPSSVQGIMEALKASSACIGTRFDEVLLKDRRLASLATYDIRLIKEEGETLWLEVNFGSFDLLQLLEDAFAGDSVRCFEDGDLHDEVSLGAALRIRASQSRR